jgi:hypothetical protein
MFYSGAGVALFAVASFNTEVLSATSPTQAAVSLRLPISGYILRGACLTQVIHVLQRR